MSHTLSLAVVGADYPNKGKSPTRRFEIALCAPCELVELRPEPDNEFDEHAIAVFSERGVQIGYIESERAVQLGLLWRAGHELTAIFQQATSWGAVVRIGVDTFPTLPPAREARREDGADPDSGFWPDPEWDQDH